MSAPDTERPHFTELSPAKPGLESPAKQVLTELSAVPQLHIPDTPGFSSGTGDSCKVRSFIKFVWIRTQLQYNLYKQTPTHLALVWKRTLQLSLPGVVVSFSEVSKNKK